MAKGSKTLYPHLPNCRCQHHHKPLPKKHQWYIKAPKYDNCFWHYIKHNSVKHTLGEIAKLMNTSISVVTAIEKKALQKLKIKLEYVLNDKKNSDHDILCKKEYDFE